MTADPAAPDEGRRSELRAIARRSEADLRQLAFDIANGRVLTTWQVPPALWINVFMPLLAMRIDPEHAAEIGMIYGDRADAIGTMCVNGFPHLHTIGFIHADDAERLRTLVVEAQDGLRRLRGDPEPAPPA